MRTESDAGRVDQHARNGRRNPRRRPQPAEGFGWGRANPYRVSLANDEIEAKELPVLEVVAGGYRLRRWFIYADGLSQLGYAGELMPLEAVGRMFKRGPVDVVGAGSAWVTLDGLGRFQTGEGYWHIKPEERIREASDLLDQVNGGQGTHFRCVEALRVYQEHPSPEQREVLRAAYEAVPEHLRMYCGNMDTKDGPIRRILSGSQDQDEPEEE